MTEQTQTEQTTETTGTETTTTTAPADTTSQTTENTETQQTAKTETETTVEAAPESADAYEIGIDGFDLAGFKESNPEVMGAFHQAGLNNSQATAVLQLWDDFNQVQVESLKEEWGGDFEQNLRFAQQAAKAAGLTDADLDSPTMGLKLAAFYGKSLQEDMPPAGNTQQNGAVDVRELMSSEAYMNPKHPEHAQTVKKVDAWYEKNYQ